MCVGSCQEDWIISARRWQEGAAQCILSNGMLGVVPAHLGGSSTESLIGSSPLTTYSRVDKYVLSCIWLRPFRELSHERDIRGVSCAWLLWGVLIVLALCQDLLCASPMGPFLP